MLVVAVLAVSYRPLLFATVDPEVAAGRGVPVRALGIVFAALVGVTAAQGVQIVGALLVMSLLITPAAAAVRVFASPAATIAASVVFAEISAVGGIVLVAGARRAGVGVRHDDLVRDLPGVLAGRPPRPRSTSS